MKASAGVFLAENVPLDNRTNRAGFDTFSLVVSIWHETNVYVGLLDNIDYEGFCWCLSGRECPVR